MNSVKSALRIALASAAFSVAMGPARAQAAGAQERFADAVRALTTARAELRAATDALWAHREALRETRRAVEARWASRIEEATRIRASAQAASERARALPERSEREEELHRQEVAKRTSLRGVEQALDAVLAALLDTEGRRQQIVMRLTELRVREQRLMEEGAAPFANRRIQPNDVTAEMVQEARTERELLDRIYQDFFPVIEAARRTARINVGMHYPAMFRSRLQIEATPRGGYCAPVREALSLYIDASIQGMEMFVTGRGDVADAAAGSRLAVAEQARILFERTDCSERSFIAGRSAQMVAEKAAEATRQLPEVRRDISSLEQSLRLAQIVLDQGPEALEAIQQRIAEGQEKLMGLRSTLLSEEPSLGAERARLAEQKADAVRSAEAAVQTAQGDLDRLTAEREVEIARALPDNQAALQTASGQINARIVALENERLFTRANLAEQLQRDYAARHLRLNSRVTIGRQGTVTICPEIINSGRLVLSSLTVTLELRGQAIPEINLRDLGLSSREIAFYPRGRTGNGPAYSDHLPPGATWRGDSNTSSCIVLSELGPGQRGAQSLVSLGGMSTNPSDWRLSIKNADVSRVGANRNTSILPEEVFRSDIERIEREAIAPAAGTASRGQATAALVSIAALDRATVTRLQSALNSAGFPVGTPDGVAGVRTRQAIQAWQSRKGYPASGELTGAQLQELVSGAR